MNALATPSLPPPPTPMQRVRRIARWMRALCLLGALGLPVATLAIWSSPTWITASAVAELGLGQVPITLTPGTHAAAAAVALLPVLAGLYALLQVWRLFGA